jgi:tetratricopeptide (TPR) repeat protein
MSLLGAGLMAANDGRFQDAERFFQIVLNEDQGSASAWSNLGNVHLSLGRPQEAVKEFNQAIALAPEVAPPTISTTVTHLGTVRFFGHLVWPYARV